MDKCEEIKVCPYRESLCQNLEELTRLRKLEKIWQKVCKRELERWQAISFYHITERCQEFTDHINNLKELIK